MRLWQGTYARALFLALLVLLVCATPAAAAQVTDRPQIIEEKQEGRVVTLTIATSAFA